MRKMLTWIGAAAVALALMVCLVALVFGNVILNEYGRGKAERAFASAHPGSWQWCAASGQLEDMAARTLVLKLHERGLIVLPERRRAPAMRRSYPGPDLFECVVVMMMTASLASKKIPALLVI